MILWDLGFSMLPLSHFPECIEMKSMPRLKTLASFHCVERGKELKFLLNLVSDISKNNEVLSMFHHCYSSITQITELLSKFHHCHSSMYYNSRCRVCLEMSSSFPFYIWACHKWYGVLQNHVRLKFSKVWEPPDQQSRMMDHGHIVIQLKLDKLIYILAY